MQDFSTFKRTTIRYWEGRRIVYNLALVAPSFFGYRFGDNLNSGGDAHDHHYTYVLIWLALSALGANICYTFCYVLEFLLGNDDPASAWMKWGRTASFIFGLLLSMLLALAGGANIAAMEWHYGLGVH